MHDKLSFHKWKDKLVVQIGAMILTINLLVLALCFVFQYKTINQILLKKDENSDMAWLEQSEYNINRFVEQIDLVMRELSSNLNLAKLVGKKDISNVTQIYHAVQAFQKMDEMEYNYPILKSICFYNKEGMILKSIKGLGTKNGNYFFQDDKKEDWFYIYGISDYLQSNGQRLQWIRAYTDVELGMGSHKKTSEKYYISVVKNNILRSGTIVLHMDMEYFIDIFSAKTDETAKTIYVIDDKYNIVAARNSDMVGRKWDFSRQMNAHNKINEYTIESDLEKKQVVVYYITALGWYLVSETPIAEITRGSKYLRCILFVSCLFSLIFSFCISVCWFSHMIRPLKRLDQIMRKVGAGQLGCIMENTPNNELGAVARQFNKMSLDLKQLFLKNQYMEKEKRKLQMQALYDQINPHLIYNVLNTIKWRALLCNERNIAESVSLLADFLQPVFRNKSLSCTVNEELNHVKNYINIMNLLRTSEYTLDLDIPNEYEDYRIPRFILQPIVENSILHGYSEENVGKIHIRMLSENGDVMIYVEDEGIGIDETKLTQLQSSLNEIKNNTGNESIDGKGTQREKGIGLVNVNRRIRNQYGQNYGLMVRCLSGKGTCVCIRIKAKME